MAAKETEIVITVESNEILTQSSWVDQQHCADTTSSAVQTIQNCFLIIDALTERICAELGGLVLTAKDDNAKAMAQVLLPKVESAVDQFDIAINETGRRDWENYSVSGMLDMVDVDTPDGKTETLLIPELRRQLSQN